MKKIFLFVSVLVLILPAMICPSGEGVRFLRQAGDLFRQRKVAEGNRLVEKAYAADPKNGSIVAAYARVSFYSGRTNRAIDALDRGIREVSGDGLKTVVNTRIYILAMAGRREAAVKALTEAMKQWPDDYALKTLKTRMDTMPGAEAPNFSGDLINGGKISLSGYKGKVVLIDFWASWCKPCRRSMLRLKELHNRYRALGLVVLGVNLDHPDRKKDCIGSLRQFGVTYPVVFGPENQVTLRRYDVRGVPISFLVDKRGIIRYRGKPLALQESLLKSLL